MKQHQVHLYAVVRVGVKNVKAETHQGAISAAEGRGNLHNLFQPCNGRDGLDVE